MSALFSKAASLWELLLFSGSCFTSNCQTNQQRRIICTFCLSSLRKNSPPSSVSSSELKQHKSNDHHPMATSWENHPTQANVQYQYVPWVLYFDWMYIKICCYIQRKTLKAIYTIVSIDSSFSEQCSMTFEHYSSSITGAPSFLCTFLLLGRLACPQPRWRGVQSGRGHG